MQVFFSAMLQGEDLLGLREELGELGNKFGEEFVESFFLVPVVGLEGEIIHYKMYVTVKPIGVLRFR